MIKLFEDFIGIPKFKVGDFVYCIDTSGTRRTDFVSGNEYYLYEDERYEIVEIIKGNKWFLCKLKELPVAYRENRFISDQEYDIKKYNL